MMLLDKGYYDYDFEPKKEQYKPIMYEDTVKSEEETRSLLARFGIGKSKEESLEELQKQVINSISTNN